jgi:hypothetical protein
MRPLQETTERYVKKSVMAFLEGEKNLKWVTGVLRRSGLGKESTMTLLLPLKGHGDPVRSQELFSWLGSSSW